MTVRQDSNTAAASASTAIFHGYPASVPLSFPLGKLAKCMIYVFRIQLKWSVRHRRMDYPKRLPDMQIGGFSLFQPHSCSTNKTASYAGLRVPSFACNSHIQIDWGRVRWQPIQTWLRFNCLLSLVSVVCTRRGLGNFDSPRKNETEELKFCSKFSNSQKILAYPKLRLDRWNLKNKENITIIAIICEKNLQFAIIVENWELKLLHYKHTGYQWYFSSMKVYPPLTSAFPKIKVRADCDCDQSPKTNHLKFFHNNESCQSQFYAINEFYLVFH